MHKGLQIDVLLSEDKQSHYQVKHFLGFNKTTDLLSQSQFWGAFQSVAPRTTSLNTASVIY